MFKRLARSILAVPLIALLSGAARAEEAPIDWAKLDLPGIDGQKINPATLTGQVVMVVNTASLCGFTKQYSGLQALWTKYKDRGFVLLGVPSNDFGEQEPGESGEIKKFCELNFGIDFPMLDKQVVTGDSAHPLFVWLATQPHGARPKWNFYKYLVGRDGRLIDSWSSFTKPESDDIATAVENALGEVAPH